MSPQCWGTVFSHQHTNELHWKKQGPVLNLTPREGVNGQGGNKWPGYTKHTDNLNIGWMSDPGGENYDIQDIFSLGHIKALFSRLLNTLRMRHKIYNKVENNL